MPVGDKAAAKAKSKGNYQDTLMKISREHAGGDPRLEGGGMMVADVFSEGSRGSRGC